ncbi:MAG TPA: hypothetical protein VJR94_08340 [Candidatus Nitrosocosmicus sp.]|nr:hypothetical protein [Candidatus Nitrosocosmicus sp.]
MRSPDHSLAKSLLCIGESCWILSMDFEISIEDFTLENQNLAGNGPN